MSDLTTRRESYLRDGYVKLAGFMPDAVLRGFLARMQIDFRRNGIDWAQMEQDGPLLKRKAIEVYGYHYPPMATLLWGMTPAIQEILGVPVLPTYCYFRLYREGDICRVHSDRPACEHSVSLTMAYSDDRDWPLEVSKQPVEAPYKRADDGFAGDEPFASVAMRPGDAVLYQGVHRHHGRTTGNPNRWSAHLFLHWVESGGRYAEQAFDGQMPPERIDFAV